ncbi:choice-of-anchor A family protein [Erysipelothrix enhydrae]|uniref:collagen-binding domain-containing protein n=1 Tax=Erysipelothrix enhydrae TaxID=2890314 RepID=UPI002B241FBD|nr:collagen-binding domain-containing protein [Erysipelothrix sp. 4322-04]WRB86702.1 choice-of-anchor A family protein [Erysipelothrix sp. 4322-04]
MKRFFSSIVLSFMMVITFSNPFVYADDLTNTWELDQVLQNYNIFSFGIASGVHIVGPVVAQGDLTHVTHISDAYDVELNPKAHIAFSQIHGGTSSYIKGKINPGNIEPQDSVLLNSIYLGSANHVSETNSNYHVNGTYFLNKNKLKPSKEVIVTDNHLDFDSIQKQFRSDSLSALKRSKEHAEKPEIVNGTLILKGGDQVVMRAEEINVIERIQLDFNLTSDIPTVLHIEGTESVNIPMTVDMNGSQTNSNENGDNNNFVINIPEAEIVSIGKPYSAPHFGHVIAPSSDVYSFVGHFAGAVIANNFWSKSEAHFHPANSPIIPSKPIIPNDPSVPEEPKEPEIPDVPEEPEIPDVPEEPGIPDVPEEPEIPEVPEEPEIPEVPEEPGIPDVPEEPEIPEVPEEPGIPEVPEEPGIPDVPEEPEIPEVPEEPEILDVPKEPGISTPQKERDPKVTKQDEWINELPLTGQGRNFGGFIILATGIVVFLRKK